jgi:tripartite-type tricarboxylate transporter receptor subunit TctC
MPGIQRILVAVAMLLGLGSLPSFAQSYPSKPIRLIVPFPPGGPADVMGRLVAQQLSESVGQVIVDNRPGAGGTIALKAAATADPDGYTLLLGGAGALAIGPALYPNSGVDPRTAFVPIAMVSATPYVMIGATTAPATVSEFMAYGKANPGKLTFGVPNGAPPHMLAEMFKARTSTDVLVVPYRGASTLITDMIAGRIHAGFETTSVMLGHISEGKTRALAVLSEARLPDLPNLPTMRESGIDMVASSWINVVAPAGTPPAIVERLRAGVVNGMRTPSVVERLKRLGSEPKSMNPDELAAHIADEYVRIGAIMRSAGVKGE